MPKRAVTFIAVWAKDWDFTDETGEFDSRGDLTNDKYHWNSETLTLQLNGITIDDPYNECALVLPDGATIEVLADSVVSQQSVEAVSIIFCGIAFYGSGTITGDGKLTINGCDNYAYSTGISLYSETEAELNIQSDVEINCGSNDDSYGIQQDEYGCNFTINLTGNLTINNTSSIKDSQDVNCNISCFKFIMTDGSLNCSVKGDEDEEDIAIAIFVAASCVISGGEFVIESSGIAFYGNTGSSVSIDDSYKNEYLITAGTSNTEAAEWDGTSDLISSDIRYVKSVKLYSIDISETTNGTVSNGDITKAAYGDNITLTITPDNGYMVDTLSVTKTGTEEAVAVTDGQFEMPAHDVTVTVTFKVIPPDEYAITVQTNGNGMASANLLSAPKNTEITLTATPDRGYHFAEWIVISGEVTITNNKFTMPAGEVTVKAMFTKNSGGGGGSSSVDESVPYIEGNHNISGWEAIENFIRNASVGDKIIINITGIFKIPADILKAIKEKNVEVTLLLNDNITATLDSNSITDTSTALYLEAKTGTSKIAQTLIDTTKKNNDTETLSITLKNIDGIRLSITLSSEAHNGEYANLFKYNKALNKLEYAGLVKVGGKTITGDISAGGEYLIVFGTSMKPGDVDNNGTVNVFDALAIMKHILELLPITYEQALDNADVTGEGTISVFDALNVLKEALG